MVEPVPCPGCERPLGVGAFFCSVCGAAARPFVTCAGCDARASVEDWFCTQCGLQIREGDPPVKPVAMALPAPEMPDVPAGGAKGITIEVEVGSSDGDRRLHESLRSAPGFTEAAIAQGHRVRVTFPASEAEALMQLAERLTLHPSRRVFRDGAERDWDDFFEFVGCYRQRAGSAAPEEHCSFDETNTPNLWGCFRLMLSLDTSHEASEWLTLGHFEKDGAFVFDKKKIVSLLDARSAPVRLCPAFEVRRISAALKALPARVNPRVDQDWVYLEDLAGDDPNAVNVHKREGDQKVKVRIHGVAPASTDAAARIARAAGDAMEGG